MGILISAFIGMLGLLIKLALAAAGMLMGTAAFFVLAACAFLLLIRAVLGD